MLLGYNKDGEIEFIFTDEKYLDKQYPNNSAKINNFWGVENHGLTEFFVSIDAFQDWDNFKKYKIVNNKLTLKDNEEIKKIRKQIKIEKNVLTMEDVKKAKDPVVVTINEQKEDLKNLLSTITVEKKEEKK